VTNPRALRRRIGSTELFCTAVGFGSASLGNRFRVLGEGDCTALVDDAWESGIRYFDTAPMYGHGLAEARLGTALRKRPRDEYLLSTKVGRLLVPDAHPAHDGMWVGIPPMRIEYDYTYDGALRSIDDSLQRMLTDRIDVVFIHDCDRYGHGANQPAVFEQALSGAARALFRLRDEGVIGAVGMGVNESDVCVEAARRADFDAFLLAGRYTLLEQGALDELLPLCDERRISVILGGIFNSGILASGVVAGAHHNYGVPAADVAERVARIEAVCRRYDASLAAVAIQFVLAHPAVASALIGASSIHQQGANLAAADDEISDDLWTDLQNEGLLRTDAPSPSRRSREQ
jgi:D-threo-aldose 1-dehydrogenase